MKIIRILLFMLGCIAFQSYAAPEQRVALVIGNAAYKSSPLQNPVNDARAMTAKLTRLGFEVIEKQNLTTKQIGATLREFRSRLKPGTEALFFYAGHGLQVKGVNYLPAVDAEITSEEEVPLQSVNVNQVLEIMEESKTRLNLIFLDACRNNPFSRRFRSAADGLAKVSAPSGTLISFATRPGSVAADGSGQNGLYTEQLLIAMDQSNVPIEQVLKQAAAGVKKVSKGQQEPWSEGMIEGEFYFIFNGPTTINVQQAKPEVSPARIKTKDQIEDEYWDEIKESTDISSFEQYRKAYPQGRYLNTASLKISQLKKQAQKPAPVIATPQPAQEDSENALWGEVQKGNSAEDYQAYLSQYPKGKYLALAKTRLKKLEDEAAEKTRIAREAAAKERAEQEQSAWDSANSSASEESYQSYLNAYPQGRYTALAQARLEKIKKEAAQAAANGPKPGTTFRDCADCPEMVVIPAGSFDMGETGSTHRVTLKSYALGKTEVTQGQWKAIMGNDPSHFTNCGDDCPVEQVSWDDAQAYIQKLNAKTGKRYRLPSESEWEYACRAGSRNEYCGSDNLDSVGWYGAYSTPAGNSAETTNRVATRQANAFGLYDMSGNVWEWVEDSYHDSYNGAPVDGSVWTGDGAKRVLRGGSWGDRPQGARAAGRFRVEPAFRIKFIGFRLARMLP